MKWADLNSKQSNKTGDPASKSIMKVLGACSPMINGSKRMLKMFFSLDMPSWIYEPSNGFRKVPVLVNDLRWETPSQDFSKARPNTYWVSETILLLWDPSFCLIILLFYIFGCTRSFTAVLHYDFVGPVIAKKTNL